jgi:beta-phosphoglucomutase-like phosphatase (HAD superfamily)
MRITTRNAHQIKAFIFDLDGTLFDSERIHFESWKQAEKKFGFEGSEKIFAKLAGTRHENADNLWLDFFNGNMEKMRLVQDFLHELKSDKLKTTRVPMKSGAREILCWLWEQKFPTALATSNFPEKIKAMFEDADLNPHFDAIIDGGMVEHGKPAPDIFLAAAAALNLSSANCAVIEDSQSGVQASLDAGTYTILIPSLPYFDPGLKHRVHWLCSSLDTVLKRLKQAETTGTAVLG